jgi:hypothetical protein
MPRFNLRRDGHSLDPLAHFKIRAVMCHLNDSVARERMLAPIQRATGAGTPKRTGVPKSEFISSLQPSAPRAAVAGGLLLARLQLHLNGYPPSLNNAMPLVKSLLPKWVGNSEFHWHPDIHLDHRPTSRRKMLEAYKEYLPVAHFWAALIHSSQNEREDIWLDSLEKVPAFLAFAECFLEMACQLPRQRGERVAADMRRKAWVFIIPTHLKRDVNITVLPLHDEQIAILNELRLFK